jgi:hypothetical protein
MNVTDRIKEFLVYFESLPKTVESIVKRQLEVSIIEYLNSLTPDETYRKLAELNNGTVPDTAPKLTVHFIQLSDRVPNEVIDTLESHIYNTAVMDLYKLTHEFTLAITSNRISASSVNQLVDQAVAAAVENPDSDMHRSLNDFTMSVCTPIYKKFSAEIIPLVNKEVSAHVNSLFK